MPLLPIVLSLAVVALFLYLLYLLSLAFVGMARSRRRAPNPANALAAKRLQDVLAKYDVHDFVFPASPPATEIAMSIDELRAKVVTPEWVSWRDVQQAELCLAAVLGDDSVLGELLMWRDRLVQILGPEWYARLSEIHRPADQDTIAQRKQLRRIIGVAYNFYQANEDAARMRKTMLRTSAIALGVLLAGVAGLGIALYVLVPRDMMMQIQFSQSSLLWLLGTSVTGAIGSFVSLQRRLQFAPGDPFDRLPQLEQEGRIALVIPLVLGAIFGALIYFLVVSNLVFGSLVQWKDGTITSPSGGPLLLVLGFVAGFAEQLVPDAVKQIAARVARSVNGSERREG